MKAVTPETFLFDTTVNINDNPNYFFIHGSVYVKNDKKYQRYTLCGFRDGDIVKIGLTVCRLDERFVKAIGRNEAVKQMVNSKWTIPVLDENPRIIRRMLYDAAATVENNFNLFKRSLAKPKETSNEISDTEI